MTNSITAVGNLTRDPELRFTQSGQAICNFSVASSRRFKKGDDWEEQTTFFNCTAWAELGENVAASLTKGSRVIVSGRMDQRSYETKDGDKRTVMDLTCDAVGAELRFAQVTVERTQRTTREDRGGQQSMDDQEPF